jgi:hypothetical protein
VEKPRTREGDCQACSDTFNRSSESGSIVFSDVFLADDLQQVENECPGGVRAGGAS